jgi:hypothetical protein
MDQLDLQALTTLDHERLLGSKELFDAAQQLGTPAAWQQAANATLTAFQERDSSMPVGFEKLLIFQLSECGAHLWEDHQDRAAAQYVNAAYDEIRSRGWRAQGNATPMGRQGSYLVATRFEIGD